MKNILLLLFITPVLLGFKLVKDPEFTVHQLPLEMHGDSVELDMEILFPAKYFHKKGWLEITPSIGGYSFGTMLFQGQKAEGNARIVPYKQGATYNYKDKIKYHSAMRQAPLLIDLTLRVKEAKQTFSIDLGNGVITTPHLLLDDEMPLRVGVDDELWVEKKLLSTVFFKRGKHQVLKNEFRKTSFLELIEKVRLIESDSSLQFLGLDLYSFDAPGGEGYMKGGILCVDRLKVVEDEIDKLLAGGNTFRKHGKLHAKGEDWTGLKLILDEMSEPEWRDELMNVFRFAQFEKRTELLNDLIESYPVLEEHLAKLRRGEIVLRYEERLPSGNTLLQIALNHPDSLSGDLLIAAAQVTHSTKKQIDIFTSFVRIYPEDWRAYNNLGASYLMLGDIVNAQRYLEQAYYIDTNDVVNYNLAIVSRRAGNMEAAGLFFNKIETINEHDKYLLALLELQRGNYPQAIELFGKKPSFNHALALTLNKEYDKAKVMLEADGLLKEELYLYAVILAKCKSYNEVLGLVKLMTDENPLYKEPLRTDYDFHALFGNSEFVAATK